MPLQNRVNPFGEILALEGRGLVMGNRGILHDDQKHVIRYSQVRRWIACKLESRGIHRIVMRPHSYTELFFLDDAAALAAGHRPCAECRNPDYRRFRDFWAACHGEPVSADSMDRQLHGERIAGRRTKRTYQDGVARLPDGAFVALDGQAWLVAQDRLLAWSSTGYAARRERPKHGTVDVLTPRSIVALLAAGYTVETHPSAR